ncbi:MAG: alanine racemase [Candidatus Eisenbacteria bacterium]|nr:alanine racemase [Candidatus Eisenbacteria bacterium]
MSRAPRQEGAAIENDAQCGETLDTGTKIILDARALTRNLRFLRKTIGPGPVFSSVIKGNAYGHGIETFVPLAEACGVRHFSVFTADEALRAVGSRNEDSSVLIMGFIADEELAWAVEHGVAFNVFETGRLAAAIEAARRVGKPAKVHLEIETGMHRTGLEGAGLEEAVELMTANAEALDVEGVCTHLAGAESISNHVRIVGQLARFRELCGDLKARGIEPRLHHVASSAALLTYPESIMDMVRCGIAQYGFWPSTEVKMHHLLSHEADGRKARRDPLRRVLTWKSRIMGLKDVEPGHFIGYGTSFQATRRHRIAAVPTGYFTGFPRDLSNKGHMLVRGRRAVVVGRVNMSMTLIDVTHIPGVERGDEVVVIGTQGRSSITVASFSDMADVMNYEALVRLPSEIPREVVL